MGRLKQNMMSIVYKYSIVRREQISILLTNLILILKRLRKYKNIIIVGDLNEDLLNPNIYNLRNFLLLNSMINIISEPTRHQAIRDPIIIPDDMEYLDSGIIVNTAIIVTTMLLIFCCPITIKYSHHLKEKHDSTRRQF